VKLGLRLPLALTVAAVLASPSPARAQTENEEGLTFDRSGFHGKAEVGLGLLGLPNARVCTNRALHFGCNSGDSSPMLELWQLFRPNPVFAMGAGATIGLFPVANAPKLDVVGISRDHKRGYLTAEMIARWYWLNGPAWESWIGGTGGLVVVSDTYTTNNEVTDRYVVGPRGVTIRTEGYTLGLAAGVSNVLSESWTVGAGFRYGLWFLPNAPARDVLGDEASLIGRVATIVIGINVGYRLQL
jgi:hypothetical protein